MTLFVLMGMVLGSGMGAGAQQHFRGDKALEIARQFVSIGPRWVTGPGHAKAEEFLRGQFKREKVEEDTFTANTPIGPVAMRNFIVRYPGNKDGVIVLATHYETNYPLRKIGFVGANDGGSTTGMLMEMGNELRAQMKDGALAGYSVWLVFLDGEEAIESWQGTDNTYGSRHLAAKWGADGTLKRVKAFLLADMLGDKDLDVQKETQSTPWLTEMVAQGSAEHGARQVLLCQGAGGGRRSSAVSEARRPGCGHHRCRLWAAYASAAGRVAPHGGRHHGQDQCEEPDGGGGCVPGDDQAGGQGQGVRDRDLGRRAGTEDERQGLRDLGRKTGTEEKDRD